MKRAHAAAAAFLAVLALVPAAADDFQLSVLALIFLFAYIGIAWNLMMGYAGQLSLGHALYIGVGAYTVAILAERYGVTPWLGMPVAFALCAALAALTGALGFRFAVRGVYFALLTIAFAEFTRIVFEHWEFVGKTGGFFLRALGPDNRPWSSLRGDATFFYYALLCTLALGWALSAALVSSRIGYEWRAIREDEDAARAIGVRAFRMKVLAASISGGLTGIAGGWFALLGGSLFPETVLGMRMSIDVIIAPIVGGLGSLSGPILGAFIVVPLNELSRDLAQHFNINGLNFLIYGALLMMIVLFAPHGLWPPIARLLRLHRWK
ncbi:MAG: branched-chain amino acid ABC transporter permease [Burkholderiales bacterium]|nr:branched-chain amino acid ABC transporter permease [Burkholderiales bacterium]